MARGHRAAVSGPSSGRRGPGRQAMAEHAGREAVAAVWRIESARIVGALARYTGDFALAEDLAQEALAEALVTWPRGGAPRNPGGWLLTVGRRHAVAPSVGATNWERVVLLYEALGRLAPSPVV